MQLSYVQYTSDELKAVKDIFTEYAQQLNVDLCFQGFEQELQQLSSVYAPPRGCIILAYQGTAVAGCVALKPIEPTVCEMKRLYVRPAYRGIALGKILVEELIAFARQCGYTSMKLDTLHTLTSAIRLYRSLGFEPTAPYVFNPLDEVLYFERKLL